MRLHHRRHRSKFPLPRVRHPHPRKPPHPPPPPPPRTKPAFPPHYVLQHHPPHHLHPVTLFTFLTIAGVQFLITHHPYIAFDNVLYYLYALCGEVILAAIYLFGTYWT